MKYETFNNLIQNCKELYDEAVKRDKDLEKVIGGDSQIMSDWWSKYIEKTIESIEEEFGDKDSTVDWLFWESICSSSGYMDFEVDGITYEGNPKNVWMELSGILDERFSKTIEEPENEKHILSDKEIKDILNKSFDASDDVYKQPDMHTESSNMNISENDKNVTIEEFLRKFWGK